MGLSKKKIGTLISLNNKKNVQDLDLPFYGINKDKSFMPTVASTGNLDKKKYKVVSRNMFVFSGMQTGRDICIRIGLYNFDYDALISPAYTTFEVTSKEILPEYLFMIFNSSEKDRYGAFLSDGSIRANLDWDVFCEIEIDVPDIDTQKKYVSIYLGLKENLDALSRGIEQMQAACDSYMERLLKTAPKKEIGSFISETDERNSDGQYDLGNLRGISNEKKFIDTKANMQGVSLKPYKIIRPDSFCYVTVTSRNGDKVSIALNESKDTYIVSSSYVTFKIVKHGLLPQYLFMFFKSSDFDRFARFNSWGSARETFAMEDLGRFEIPVPSEEIQQDIINIFLVMSERKLLRDRLIELQKKICPILIKGAVEEGGRA